MRRIVAELVGPRRWWSDCYCDARDCQEWSGKDRRYCTPRCQNTEAARRKRYRSILRRVGATCRECGVTHHDDGTVTLLNGGRRS